LQYRKQAVLSTVLAMVGGLVVGLTPAQGAPERVVSYHGYQVSVPSGWPVIDLSKDPTACVRLDRSAIYLGHSSAQADCPAQPAGRSAGLIVEPLSSAAADRSATRALPGTATAPAGTRSVSGEIQVAVEDAGVLVTAYHAPDQEQAVRGILADARLTSGGKAARLIRPQVAAALAATPIVATGTLQNQAFDTCEAPTQASMDAWRSPASPYKAVGIYISGGLRRCPQLNLTSSWVAANAANGWQFLLLDVGMQAPCSNFSSKMSTDPATARAQGRSAAAQAVAAATALGFGQRSAIYSDIESYPSNASCKASVLSYVSGWTLELNARGFVGGVYTGAASGGIDLSSEYNSTVYTRPDNLWFARWNGVNGTADDKYIPTTYWTNHQRVHQFVGDTDETYGGVKLRIDRNSANLTAPPPPVTGFDAAGQYAKATLNWALPTGITLGQVIVRSSAGTTPPATLTSGTAVYAGTGTSTTVGLASSTNYSFRAWVKDSSGKVSPVADTRLGGTRATIAANTGAISYGGSVTVTGNLTRLDTGGPLAGLPVSLYARTKNSTAWREVIRLTSSATGTVSYVHKPTVSTIYEWGYNGSPDLLGSRTADKLVEVRPTITANLSVTAIKLGGYTGFYGYLRPQHVGQTVYLQRLVGTSWTNVTTTKLNTTGNYSFVIRPTTRGTFSYRAVWLGDGDHATSVSATKTFTVS
jgi:hypothetical protein